MAEREPLIGRAGDLQVLETAIGRAKSGTGGAVLVEGPAGIGKSRLLAEFAAKARVSGLQVLDARAIQSEKDVAFATALQLFEPAIASRSDVAELFDGAAALARPLLSGDYPDVAVGSPFPLQHGLFWLTVNLTHSGPLTVCVDDAQWSDQGSIGFLHYLVRRIIDLPVVLVVATRPRDPRTSNELDALRESWQGDRIRLEPLSRDEVALLVLARFPSADEEFCDACADVTRGIPHYVGELLRSVAAERLEPTAARSDRLREVGFASISRACLFRLARLGPDPVALARAMCVLGDGTPLRRAAALANLSGDRAAAAADALAAEELMVAGSTLSFAHPLIAQLVRDEVPAAALAIAHAHAARVLAADDASAEVVAAHLMRAPADSSRWVVDNLRSAARRARAKGAPDVAATLLARALEEPPVPAERVDVLAELGSAESAAGLPAGVDHLRTVLELREDIAGREDACRQLARALAGLGQRREAATLLEQALREAGELATAVPLLTDYVVNAAFEPGLRQQVFSETLGLLEAAPTGGTSAERALLAALAMRSGQECEPAARTIELADRAWADGVLLAEQGPDGPGWLMTVWAFELAEEHTRAEAVALATVDLARRSGSVEAFATASMFSAWARSAMGQVVEAQADLAQAVAASQLGWRRYLVAALSRQATLHLWRGDIRAASLALETAHEYDSGGGMEVPWRLHASGHLAMAQHDIAEALRLYLQAGDWLSVNLGVDYTVLTWRTDAARAAFALGDVDQAGELVAHEAALAARSLAPGHLGRVLRTRGWITGGEEGVALLRQATGHLAAAGALLERADALTDLGCLLRRQGARAEARPHLAEALDIMTSTGASGLAVRARDELAATGARRQTARTSGLSSLTPSERRVAQLAAEGLSNPRVAQALFVTPKTVEYHLRHVYQKLTITGRGQLKTALDQAEPTNS